MLELRTRSTHSFKNTRNNSNPDLDFFFITLTKKNIRYRSFQQTSLLCVNCSAITIRAIEMLSCLVSGLYRFYRNPKKENICLFPYSSNFYQNKTITMKFGYIVNNSTLVILSRIVSFLQGYKYEYIFIHSTISVKCLKLL